MNKFLLWLGVVIAVWSLTISGHKSIYYVLSVLGYVAVAWMLTFRSDFLQSLSGNEP